MFRAWFRCAPQKKTQRNKNTFGCVCTSPNTARKMALKTAKRHHSESSSNILAFSSQRASDLSSLAETETETENTVKWCLPMTGLSDRARVFGVGSRKSTGEISGQVRKAGGFQQSSQPFWSLRFRFLEANWTLFTDTF